MDINKLYDNFLARFKFFREFIKFLTELNTRLETIALDTSSMRREIEELKEENENLNKRVAEISNKSLGTDFIQGSASIRDQYYKNYNAKA